MKWFIGTTIALGVLAIYTHLGASNSEQDFPPIGDFAQIGELRMHYYEAGSGPALVLIHGASTNLSDFLKMQSRHYVEIKKPLMLVIGDADDIVPAWNHADRLTQQVANAQRIVLKETGHALHHAHPSRVAGIIEAFSDRIWSYANRTSDTLDL